MRRPVGVIVAGILLGIVALFGILSEIATLGIFIFSHSPVIPKIPGMRGVMISVTAVELAFFVFCAWTAVALFMLRPWARVAAIAIAGLFTFFSAIMGLGVLLGRHYAAMLPPGPASANVDTVMVVLALCCFVFSAISIWWFIYFNFSQVRRAFAGPQAATFDTGAMGTTEVIAAPAQTGTSGWRVVIIGWACLMLLSSLYLLSVFWTHLPMFLFGAILSGPAADLFVVAMCAVEIYMGIGLLRKWRPAWYLSLLFQVYILGYSAEFLLPGVRARFMVYMQDIMERTSSGVVPPLDFMGSTMALAFGIGVIIAFLLIWALIARREDYLHA